MPDDRCGGRARVERGSLWSVLGRPEASRRSTNERAGGEEASQDAQDDGGGLACICSLHFLVLISDC